MIHYHGTPISGPSTVSVAALSGGHAFVSHSDPGALSVAAEICQSFALDCGAFGAWRAGRPINDWSRYYDWAADCLRHPACDWAIIPDVIDGDEPDNDSLLREWPMPKWAGVPVWHMHERLDRLQLLAADWPRVAIGSSGEFARVGTPEWWARMHEAMSIVCDRDGRPLVKLHGLRMLDPAVFSRLPLASADSTNVARNVGIDRAWTGSYQPPNRESRAMILRSRIESINGAQRWDGVPESMPIHQGILL